ISAGPPHADKEGISMSGRHPADGPQPPVSGRGSSRERAPAMQTQILQRPVYWDAQQQATLRCPACGRSKVVDVSRYVQAAKPPKVHCACGQRFRVPLAASLAARYACPTCAGTGALVVEEGTQVTISEAGYHYHRRQRKQPCATCGGLGMHYPHPA